MYTNVYMNMYLYIVCVRSTPTLPSPPLLSVAIDQFRHIRP